MSFANKKESQERQNNALIMTRINQSDKKVHKLHYTKNEQCNGETFYQHIFIGRMNI